MLRWLHALRWGWCMCGLTGKDRSASTFIMFSPSSLPISVFWWAGDFQEIPRHLGTFLLGGDSVLFYPKELCSWLLICKENTFSVEYTPATGEACSFNKVTGFFFGVWFFFSVTAWGNGVKEWRDRSDNIHPGMISSYACWVAAREVTHFLPGVGGTWDLTISEPPWSGPGEEGLPGLELKEKISGKCCRKFNPTQSSSSAHVGKHSKLDCAGNLFFCPSFEPSWDAQR